LNQIQIMEVKHRKLLKAPLEAGASKGGKQA
jgi:hypothetical protein